MNLLNRWWVIFLTLPHLSIYYFGLEKIQPYIFAWQFVVIPIAIMLIFKKISVFNLVMVFFMFIMILSSFANGNLTSGIIYTTATFIGFCFYVTYAIKNFRELITGLYYLMAIIIVANFITMLNPQGVALSSNGYPYFLIGGKNAIQMVALPTIAIAYLYSYVIHNKLKILPFLVILISVVSTYISESGTGIVVALLALLFILLPKKVFPSPNTYFLINIVAFLSIVIFRFQEVLFGNFITNVLHKDITFTGRIYIWDYTMNIIKENWFFGVGRGNEVISEQFANLNQTHNGFLEILLFSGVFGALFFILIIILVGKQLNSSSKHVYSKILSFSVFSYLIIGLTESVYLRKEFWLLLIIAYGIKDIIKQSDSIGSPILINKEQRVMVVYKKAQ